MRVTLTAPVRHDGTTLPAGAVIDIEDECAARLVRLGVAVPAAEEVDSPAPEEAAPEEAAPDESGSEEPKDSETGSGIDDDGEDGGDQGTGAGNDDDGDQEAGSGNDDDGPELPPDKPPQEMTVAELRAELLVLNVKVPSKASKADLLQAYMDAVLQLDGATGAEWE